MNNSSSPSTTLTIAQMEQAIQNVVAAKANMNPAQPATYEEIAAEVSKLPGVQMDTKDVGAYLKKHGGNITNWWLIVSADGRLLIRDKQQRLVQHTKLKEYGCEFQGTDVVLL